MNPNSETVMVKALSPVSVAGAVAESGETFVAPLEVVREALARGLVERVEAKARSKSK